MQIATDPPRLIAEGTSPDKRRREILVARETYRAPSRGSGCPADHGVGPGRDGHGHEARWLLDELARQEPCSPGERKHVAVQSSFGLLVLCATTKERSRFDRPPRPPRRYDGRSSPCPDARDPAGVLRPTVRDREGVEQAPLAGGRRAVVDRGLGDVSTPPSEDRGQIPLARHLSEPG